MGYRLGVDLGTTYTAAALWREGAISMVSLGTRATSIPSVVLIEASGSIVVGEVAAQRGRREAQGLVREFKRRIGDPEPFRVLGRSFAPELLQARLLSSVLATVTEREGGAPESVVLTHPANWGDYRLEMLDEVARQGGLSTYQRLSEPEAAALQYASLSRVENGSVVAIYDLGGGTFDACVLRKTDDRFVLAARPGGIDRLGGVDFDDVVVGFVSRALGPELAKLDMDDPAVFRDLARLRLDCVEAKEQLSASAEAVIPISIGELRTEIRLTRSEFETLIEPLVDLTVEALERTIAEAGIEPEDLRSVLLVGGSSRIPLIGRRITEQLRRPVAVDSHPKDVVALGAAAFAGLGETATVPRVPAPQVLPLVPAVPQLPVAGGFSKKDLARLAGVMLVVAAAIVGGVRFLGGGSPKAKQPTVTTTRPVVASTTSETIPQELRSLRVAYLTYAGHLLAWSQDKGAIEDESVLEEACRNEVNDLNKVVVASVGRTARSVINSGPVSLRGEFEDYLKSADTTFVNCKNTGSVLQLCNDVATVETNYELVRLEALADAPEDPFFTTLAVGSGCRQ